jgi:hypothetical protein
MENDRYVVFSDLHGRVDLLEACYRRYGDTVTYISGGDVVDAPEYGNVRATIDLLLGIGARCIYGNHEWVLAASMYCGEQESRQAWAYTWSGYQRGVLRSYGLEEPSPVSRRSYDYFAAATALRDAVEAEGHTAFFDSLKPYHETAQFLVVHAGITNTAWTGEDTSQKAWLDSVGETEVSARREARQWNAEPIQIFDPSYALATTFAAPASLNKTLITGHAHNAESSLTRVTDNGKRVRIAGVVSEGAPLYVYESWTGGVVPVHA